VIEDLENLPEVSFIDNATLEDVKAAMVADYKKRYAEITGYEPILGKADAVTLLMYAAAVQIYQTMKYVDIGAKMSLLKYSAGDYLDNLGALKGVLRLPEAPAVVTERFTLSALQADTVVIPIGTRVTDGRLYFETTEYAEIPAGELYVDVVMTCQTSGTDGNGIEIGRLNILVDPIPYMQSVENIEATAGGSYREADDPYRERIYLAPDRYSVAGPEAAYIYWAKSQSAAVLDVAVFSPVPGQVIVEFLTTGGEIPTAAQIAAMADWLNDAEIRPLTDQVTVQAPSIATFDVDFTYYISAKDRAKAAAIQAAVAKAVDEYVLWQQSHIGQDIVPDRLIQLVREAGAKRLVIRLPDFQVVGAEGVARLGQMSISYGGLEDA
jgi:phage-related baseplate assembly protein